MKLILPLLLFLSIPLNGLAQEKTDIFRLRKEGKVDSIIYFLTNNTGPTYKYWLHTQDQRYGVISFCDSIIDKTLEISMDQFEKRKVQEKFDEHDTNYTSPLHITLFSAALIDSMKSNPDAMSNNNQMPNIFLKRSADDFMVKNSNFLITFLYLDRFELNEDSVRMNLSQLESFYTIQILHNYYEKCVNMDTMKIPDVMQDRNLRLIAERLAKVESENFVLYQSYSSKNRPIKAVDFFMDNDVFTFIGINQDREYTGGGALTIYTDYLKWRWVNIGWIRNIGFNEQQRIFNKTKNRRPVLTYQSAKLGMHFFTPYIRYRENFDLADSLYQTDRPFGSFIYFERSKYRLWSTGLMRHQGNLQVGKIGTMAGRNIQAVLHQDVITASQKVYGWDNQIGNGGRWTGQLNQKIDFMLISSTNNYHSIFTPNKRNDDNERETTNPPRLRDKLWGPVGKRYLGISCYNSTEMMIGGYYTAIGTGIFISGLDFTDQSGNATIAARRNNEYEFGFNWELGFRYRRVLHNSMLEGFGFLNTFLDDEYDDEAETVYALSSNQINRDIFMMELKLNFRWRKTTAYWNLTLHNLEYDQVDVDYTGLNSLVNPNLKDQQFYSDKVITELNFFNGLSYYGYGRFGVTWLLD